MPDSRRATGARYALAAALAAGVVAMPQTVVADACLSGALDAATTAVRAVFGPDAGVTLDDVVCSVAPGATRVDAAAAEPGSRTDGPVRFVLYTQEGAERRRAGRLTAHVGVAVPHLRSAVALGVRAIVTPAEVVEAAGPIGRVPFVALPGRAEVDGARLRRPVPAGAVLTATVLEPVALVRSGMDVVTLARVDGVEVRGRAVAAQDGQRGDIVIVINPDSRKRLRGRVVDDAVVEVLHVP